MREGYFCYNCIYWINADGGKCKLVEDDGPDVMGKVSDVIAPHGCCAGYEPNYDKLSDTTKTENRKTVASTEMMIRLYCVVRPYHDMHVIQGPLYTVDRQFKN